MISLAGRSVGATCVLHPPEEPLFRFVVVPIWLAWLTSSLPYLWTCRLDTVSRSPLPLTQQRLHLLQVCFCGAYRYWIAAPETVTKYNVEHMPSDTSFNRHLCSRRFCLFAYRLLRAELWRECADTYRYVSEFRQTVYPRAPGGNSKPGAPGGNSKPGAPARWRQSGWYDRCSSHTISVRVVQYNQRFGWGMFFDSGALDVYVLGRCTRWSAYRIPSVTSSYCNAHPTDIVLQCWHASIHAPKR